MLEVRLIGKFDIQCDGKTVILSSRAAQSLFAYLILTAGTLHRREKLAGMLWPEESEQKARTYLRNELWRIRKALPQTSKVEYLLADNLSVGFNPASAYWLDVAGLKNLSETASAEELIQSLSNYQGELLPGFYEDWIVFEREHLQVLFEQKIACLLEILEKEQRWNEILEWAERWISLAQAPEAAYRALMVAYDALGDQAKVTATYERCRRALSQLDLEPSEETRALAFKRSSRIKVPIPLTSFIGREKELKEVAGLFSKSRLVTLTGSGGVGKTRLAIQVVAEVMDLFPDGVWFLDLAPLSDPSLVPNTLANLLGLRESGEIPVNDLLINYFRIRRALVIFDNCEHLIDSCAQLINSLLITCEYLSVLTTSRETLRASGELPYRVPSLEIPRADIESNIIELSNVEAIKLFVDRVSVASPGFVLSQENVVPITQICQRLDGVPLAIELTAARTIMLSVEQILTGLDDRFNLLTHGLRSSLPRHQTLRAAIDWSYDLLLPAEQVLFQRLSVFVGGWTLEAVEAVCAYGSIKSEDILNLMEQLIRKSFVIKEEVRGESRYHLLETIRQFAREKLLEAGGSEAVRNKHLVYFVELAEQAKPELYSFNQVFWLNKLEDELDNTRMALEWALATDPESGLRLIVSPWLFWDARGDVRELEGWLAQLLEQYHGVDALRARALALHSQTLKNREELVNKARVIAEESLELSRAISDQSAEAFSLCSLGIISDAQEDRGISYSLLEESVALYGSLGDKFGQAEVMRELGSMLAHTNPSDINLLLESLRLYREMGHLSAIASCLCALAFMTIRGGDFSAPAQWLEEAHMLYRQLGSQVGEGDVSRVCGLLAYWQGDFNRACTYFEESIALTGVSGRKDSWVHASMAYSILRQGDTVRAKKIFGFCIQQFQKANSMGGLAFTIDGLASLNVEQKQPERAARLFACVDATREKINYPRPPVEQASVERDLAMIHSQISDTAFENAYESGKAMALEEAVAFALEALK